MLHGSCPLLLPLLLPRRLLRLRVLLLGYLTGF
jgi:hypothetical protein